MILGDGDLNIGEEVVQHNGHTLDVAVVFGLNAEQVYRPGGKHKTMIPSLFLAGERIPVQDPFERAAM